MTLTANKIKKVAIYSRKSRPDETEEVLQRQLAFLIDKCVENNWEFEVFQEVGSSQSIDEKVRPELNKMLEKVQSYHYDAIVVTDQDRLSRNTAGFSQIKEILTNYGVQVVTSSKIYDYNTQEDDLMSDMQSIVAKQEYLNIKKRLVRGKRQSAKEGNWVGGKTPVGYSYDHKTKKLVPDENAPVIKRIYDLYLSGKSSTDIERILDLEGTLTPTGSKWNKARISVVLSNPVYKGTVVYGKTKVSKVEKKPSGSPKQFKTDESNQIIIENAHEPIIAPEDWENAKAIREGRLTKPPSARIGKVIFTGLIKCAICGRTHSFQRRKGKELRITSCQTRYYDEDGINYTVCKNKGVRLDHFEQVFFAKFSQFVNQLELYLEDIKKNIKKDETNPADEKAILTANIKKIDASIKRVQKGFIAEIYTEEEAQKEIKQLKAQKEYLEEQIKRLDTKTKDEKLDELQAVLDKLKQLLEGTSDLETKEINHLLTSLIDHIEYKRVGDHKAEIEMKIHYKGQSGEQAS
ncbi:recombinase family protein [Schinkia azotoformans]|uniref:Recombinase family protein n=1 Tax=Schinkia azotoformans LMG 9581 TaxID=1131731 RepID=K6C8D2_SCHAZ|nr:recombinase family protein [Schinkia azotoformans]EKN67400.1 recombinase family protein [Schinkia azotoformans LMG 9581]MEC1639347.1 recombinase family protein [Schinkia azotoformans]MEC1944399.1 recombinase family protein [Schinkia azotoformans]